MTSAEDALVLAGEFERATRREWMDLVAGALTRGGADTSSEAVARLFDRRLVTRTLDGLQIQPLYTGEDTPGPPPSPVTRGVLSAGAPGERSAGKPWDIRVRVDVADDGSSAGTAAVEELNNGATSILLGLRGAAAVDVDVLDRALDGVYLDIAPVVLDAGDRFEAAAEALTGLWARRGVAPDAPAGGFGADPLGEYARTGGAVPAEAGLEAAARLARRCVADHPGVRALVVDSTVYHEAGGSAAFELGCGLATGVAYLRALTDAGLSVDEACGQLEFRLSSSADQFTSIAALRASRRCWARVASVAGAAADTVAQRQHAVTSTAMTSRYDPWVNLLRTTVAAFSAGVGGAGSVTVVPHDALRTGGGSVLAKRMARNVSHVLVDESHLARVADPAGGSWYVERLTADLAMAAWAWFTEIEAAGGMTAALAAGVVGGRLTSEWDTRRRRLVERKDRLCGVSQFPNLAEEPPPPTAPPAATSGSAFPPLAPRRYAEPFEAERERADRVAAETGESPSVYLAALGPLAVYSARAGFAQNLFGTAGIRSLTGPPAEFAASGARIACICSSDAVYAEQAEAAAAALKAAGAQRVYLAGRPADDEQRRALEAAGVDEFVFVGCDVVDVVHRALDAAGVA